MNHKLTKGKTLNLFMLIAPTIIFIAMFIDMMVNIDTYKTLNMVVGIWAYFSITLIISVLGLIVTVFNTIQIFKKPENIHHIRIALEVSRIAYTLEVIYIIQYIYMQSVFETVSGLTIATLVLGCIAMIGFIVTPLLKVKKEVTFMCYCGTGLLYIVFMILMSVLCNTRDNGFHIIMLFMYTITICVSAYALYYSYLRKPIEHKETENK